MERFTALFNVRFGIPLQFHVATNYDDSCIRIVDDIKFLDELILNSFTIKISTHPLNFLSLENSAVVVACRLVRLVALTSQRRISSARIEFHNSACLHVHFIIMNHLLKTEYVLQK